MKREIRLYVTDDFFPKNLLIYFYFLISVYKEVGRRLGDRPLRFYTRKLVRTYLYGGRQGGIVYGPRPTDDMSKKDQKLRGVGKRSVEEGLTTGRVSLLFPFPSSSIRLVSKEKMTPFSILSFPSIIFFDKSQRT